MSTPPGYGTGHQLAIWVAWPNTAADFDLYVLDAAGQRRRHLGLLAPTRSWCCSRRTAATTPCASCPTRRWASRSPARRELTTTPANPAAGRLPGPAYRNYAAPESLPDAHNAGEPSIGVEPGDRRGHVPGLHVDLPRRLRRRRPPPATWQDRSASATNGCPQGSTTSLDPILFTDRQTGRTFESQLAGKAALTCYTDDDGDDLDPDAGLGHQQRRRPPDDRRRPVRRRTALGAADRLPERRLLLLAGHRRRARAPAATTAA